MATIGYPKGAIRTGYDESNRDENLEQGDTSYDNAELRSSEDNRNTLDRQAKVAIDWSIRNLDTDELIRPQFPMPEDGVRVTIGGNLVKQARFGMQDPIVHWTHGNPRDITFNAVLFTRHKDEADAVMDLYEQIEELAIKYEDLGRPPICLFTFGWYSEIVLVERIDPNYVSVNDEWAPREIQISFSMTKYVPFSQAKIDPTKPAKESFHLIASQAEQMYEAIALSYYGDPLYGDRIRKRHPQEPFAPRVGSLVKVPPKPIVLRETVEPAFHALSLTDQDAVDNFEEILAYRSARAVTVVV